MFAAVEALEVFPVAVEFAAALLGLSEGSPDAKVFCPEAGVGLGCWTEPFFVCRTRMLF